MSENISTSGVTRRHELKTDPAVFAAVLAGAKTHEIRKNDRGFAVDDELVLRETKHDGAQMQMFPAMFPLEYTGRTITRSVSHILTGYGLQDGWCILSLAPVAAAPEGVAKEMHLCAVAGAGRWPHPGDRWVFKAAEGCSYCAELARRANVAPNNQGTAS